jgi:hypothetical protein
VKEGVCTARVKCGRMVKWLCELLIKNHMKYFQPEFGTGAFRYQLIFSHRTKKKYDFGLYLSIAIEVLRGIFCQYEMIQKD